jgi:hypothetical protein
MEENLAFFNMKIRHDMYAEHFIDRLFFQVINLVALFTDKYMGYFFPDFSLFFHKFSDENLLLFTFFSKYY